MLLPVCGKRAKFCGVEPWAGLLWLWAGSLALLVLFGVAHWSRYAMNNGRAQIHPLDATLKWKKARQALWWRRVGTVERAALTSKLEWSWRFPLAGFPGVKEGPGVTGLLTSLINVLPIFPRSPISRNNPIKCLVNILYNHPLVVFYSLIKYFTNFSMVKVLKIAQAFLFPQNNISYS